MCMGMQAYMYRYLYACALNTHVNTYKHRPMHPYVTTYKHPNFLTRICKQAHIHLCIFMSNYLQIFIGYTASAFLFEIYWFR